MSVTSADQGEGKLCTHLLQRGSTYYIRRVIPVDLQVHYGRKEIVRSLRTKDRREAVVKLRKQDVELDAEFERVRASLAAPQGAASVSAPAPKPSSPEPINADEVASHALALIRQRRDEAAAHGYVALTEFMERQRKNLLDQEAMLAGEMEPLHTLSKHEGWRNALQAFLTGDGSVQERLRVIPAPPRNEAYGGSSEPRAGATVMLSTVVRRFLDAQDNKAPMFQKYQVALSLFLEFIGDIPVSRLRQLDVDGYFDMLSKLPPRWSDEVRRKGITARELAEQNRGNTIAPKTFEGTYAAAVRPFLVEAKRLFGDQGFPQNLTTDGIKYRGNQKEAKNKQRAFTEAELKRLFEGSAYAALAADSKHPGRYWLPLIGLYSGARVNEICQLNPQCDIREEQGIWFFDFNEEAEGHEAITKSVKTASSKRTVPIHSKLIELGFLQYVERMKAANQTLLFPVWKPTRGRASPKAEKWFTRFLESIGLRDGTPGKRIAGMHAFRHTILHYAFNHDIAGIEVITGHVGEASAVVRGYRGEKTLRNKQRILEQVRFDVQPSRFQGQ